MKIIINYDSCWQTSFLGNDEKKPVSQKNKKKNFHASEGFEQKFVATSSTRGERPSPISDNTILGVLCRLIGDQRKLYQARSKENFYFADMEDKISWSLSKENTVSELMYLTNKSDDRCAQSTWLGVLPNDSPWFFSDISPIFWSVLYLDRDELLTFILSENVHHPDSAEAQSCRPKTLLMRVSEISDTDNKLMKPWNNREKLSSERDKKREQIDNEGLKKKDLVTKFEAKKTTNLSQKSALEKKVSALDVKIQTLLGELNNIETDIQNVPLESKIIRVTDFLEKQFPGNSYWSNGVLYPSRLYAAALYLQAERMIKKGYLLDFAINKKGEIQIQGFSKRGFNGIRDWLNPIAGGRKKSVGTPCQVRKQTGKLEIRLDVEPEKGREIDEMIKAAGVSSFYLGKKGLAYVSYIRI